MVDGACQDEQGRRQKASVRAIALPNACCPTSKRQASACAAWAYSIDLCTTTAAINQALPSTHAVGNWDSKAHWRGTQCAPKL